MNGAKIIGIVHPFDTILLGSKITQGERGSGNNDLLDRARIKMLQRLIMLSLIKGTIIHACEHVVTLYVDALAIGFEITVNQACAARVNQSVTLHVYMHWNQEQGPSLYGFETRTERECFILLIDCQGVGPKLALSLLGQISINELATIVQANDVKALSALKGIGLKKAEQLILYLKNKIDDFMIEHAPAGATGSSFQQVIQVLESLNYGHTEIQHAISQLHQQQLGTLPFDTLLRKALAVLAKKA